jgi:hypothetical protein
MDRFLPDTRDPLDPVCELDGNDDVQGSARERCEVKRDWLERAAWSKICRRPLYTEVVDDRLHSGGLGDQLKT